MMLIPRTPAPDPAGRCARRWPVWPWRRPGSSCWTAAGRRALPPPFRDLPNPPACGFRCGRNIVQQRLRDGVLAGRDADLASCSLRWKRPRPAALPLHFAHAGSRRPSAAVRPCMASIASACESMNFFCQPRSVACPLPAGWAGSAAARRPAPLISSCSQVWVSGLAAGVSSVSVASSSCGRSRSRARNSERMAMAIAS